MGAQSNRETKYGRPISNAAPGTRFEFLVAAFSILDGKGATPPEHLAKLKEARAIRDAKLSVDFGLDILSRSGLTIEQINGMDPFWRKAICHWLNEGRNSGSRNWRSTLAATTKGAFALRYDNRINLRALMAATRFLRSRGVTRPKDVLAWLNNRRGARQGEISGSARAGGLTRDSLRSATRMLRRYIAACPSYTLSRLREDTTRVRRLEEVISARMPHASLGGSALAEALDDKFGLAFEVFFADGGPVQTSQTEHASAQLFCVGRADSLGSEVPNATRYPPGREGGATNDGSGSGKGLWPLHDVG